LLAAAFRACIKTCDFAVWLVGPTGVFKSEPAALAQQHYGAAMNARHLPGNFASTGNSIEAMAFLAKDALLVIDDFAPQGGLQDMARYHSTADRILRAAGNNQGRGRLRADATLHNQRAPRGLILATGEDVPRGHSIRARTFIIEIAPGDVRTNILSDCQAAAAEGLLAASLGAFVRWLAPKYDHVLHTLQKRVIELRSVATTPHSRTPGIVADLQAGIELLAAFAVEAGALLAEEQEQLTGQCWHALNQVAAAQRAQQESSEPTGVFLSLLRAAILSGKAHVADVNGSAPSDGERWGWKSVGAGENERWLSQGERVGWIDGDDLYLEPTASYTIAQKFGRDGGQPIVVSEGVLKKRLNEKGFLVTTDQTRGTLAVRKRIRGTPIAVLHLQAQTLFECVRFSAPEVG